MLKPKPAGGHSHTAVMTPYQQEQLTAHRLVRDHLGSLNANQRRDLHRACEAYCRFRDRVDRFLADHFADVCSQKCFRSRTSACCSRDGIVTFFADVVVNALLSDPAELRLLTHTLQGPPNGAKCIYLGPSGCRWKLRPLLCAMFLCDSAQAQVLATDPERERQWQVLRQAAKGFRWPDRPVLFDMLEARFIAAGHRSPLMYLHDSPGLLRVKRRAGLVGAANPTRTSP
jgi:hypothetical protein